MMDQDLHLWTDTSYYARRGSEIAGGGPSDHCLRPVVRHHGSTNPFLARGIGSRAIDCNVLLRTDFEGRGGVSFLIMIARRFWRGVIDDG